MTGGSGRADGRSAGGRRFALVAGGGTAGHLQPALAIAEALVARGHDRATIEFVGSERGQDADMLAGRGFPVTLLPGPGHRAAASTPGTWCATPARPGNCWWPPPGRSGWSGGPGPGWSWPSAATPAWPARSAAVVHRVPLVLVNVDAVPGAANRLLGRFAAASAVGWEGNPLPRAVVTGTPVRPAIAAVDRSPPGPVGGAGGDSACPRTAPWWSPSAAPSAPARSTGPSTAWPARWAGRGDVAIYHIVGRRDWAADDADRRATDPAVRAGDGPSAGPGALRGAHAHGLRGGRPGGLPGRGHDGGRAGRGRRARGARAPARGARATTRRPTPGCSSGSGAAVLLPDPECTPAGLADVVEGLLADPDRLAAMGGRPQALGRPDAAAAGAGGRRGQRPAGAA